MSKQEEKEYMYKVLETHQVEDGKIYDPMYDCMFTMDQAKRSIDILIDLAVHGEDGSIIDKIIAMPLNDTIDLAEKAINMMHDEEIIDDDVYRKALSNISMAVC